MIGGPASINFGRPLPLCKASSVIRNTVPVPGRSQSSFVYCSVDYIYCLSYRNGKAVDVHTEFQKLVVNSTTIVCNLHERQRSSQEILDLADYLQVHYPKGKGALPPLANRTSGKYKYDSPKKSFSLGIIPLWIEITDINSFFTYCKKEFGSDDDVMLIYDSYTHPSTAVQYPSHYNDMKEFCRMQKWRCTRSQDDYVMGSEASVTILWNGKFRYENFTRAKHRLIIITIAGKQRCFLQFQSSFVYFDMICSFL